jgi:RNA polymerase sigma-70 factor (ECF subfamily)
MITTAANPWTLDLADARGGDGRAAALPARATREAPREDAATTLLVATGAGDRAAFERLYRATAPRLLAVALRLLRDRASAEDVLQECFVIVWQRAAAFAPERASAMTWMNTIVRHRCLDRLRSRPREATIDDTDAHGDPIANLPDGRPDPEHRLAEAQSEGRAARMLERLPGHYRQALTLAFRAGLSHSEIATHLGVPLGTAKSWVRRGLEELGRQWDRSPV